MDCHREEQLRSANPNLQWLRDIILAAAPERHFNRALTTTDLLGIADGAGIEFPGGPNREKESTRAGKLLGRLYTAEDSNVLIVDGFSVRRSKIPISTSKGQKDQSQYFIARN